MKRLVVPSKTLGEFLLLLLECFHQIDSFPDCPGRTRVIDSLNMARDWCMFCFKGCKDETK